MSSLQVARRRNSGLTTEDGRRRLYHREKKIPHTEKKKRERKSVIIIEVNLAGLGMKTLSVRVHVMFKCETWAASENELGLKCLTVGAVILSKLNLAFKSISSEPRRHARAASSLTCGNVEKKKEKKEMKIIIRRIIFWLGISTAHLFVLHV